MRQPLSVHPQISHRLPLEDRWAIHSLYFDGSDDRVRIPHDASLNPTDAITVETWAYFESLPAVTGAVSKWAYGNDGTLNGPAWREVDKHQLQAEVGL